MGCWNTTCAVSNLPIFAGEEVVVFLLTQNRYGFMKDFVRNTCYFEPCLLPFYGEYDDYGSVENCHGVGLPILLDRVQQNLEELPVGKNKYHDIAATKEKMTNSDYLFELDHEDRLFIKYQSTLPDSKEKSLKVVHAQVKKSIFDYILKNWEQRVFLGWDDKEKDFKYRPYKFSDVVKDFEKGIKKFKPSEDGYVPYRIESNLFDHKSLAFSCFYEELGSPLLSVTDAFGEKNYKELLFEMLKGGFINSFMSQTRRPWIKPIGNGSQNTEPGPHKLLADAVITVLNSEKEEHGQW